MDDKGWAQASTGRLRTTQSVRCCRLQDLTRLIPPRSLISPRKRALTDMQKRIGFGVGAFVLVAAFVWIVFDNLALGLIFGLIAGAGAGKAVRSPPSANDRDQSGGA